MIILSDFLPKWKVQLIHCLTPDLYDLQGPSFPFYLSKVLPLTHLDLSIIHISFYSKIISSSMLFSLITFSFFNNLLFIFSQKVWQVGKLPHFLFALTSCLYQFLSAPFQTSCYLPASCLLEDIKPGFFILPGSSPGLLHTCDRHPRLSLFCRSSSFHVLPLKCSRGRK